MSFKFNWASFNDDNFYDRVRTLLTDALNKGNKPLILSDRILVRELYLGEESPQLEILEIGDLADDRFRGIFKLTYNGEASITLATKIQANPLKLYSMSAPSFTTPKFLGANSPLDIPLNLTLSDIRLSGIIILVFSKAKGLTLVFRNDPLESIRVSSTFDALPGIARFLQVQIENQIRSLFREELPAILHRLSHRWTPSSGLVLHKGVANGERGVEDAASSILDEENVKEEAKVMFMDINPDMPVISAANMVKIEVLSASQQTLSLFSPSIPEAIYRANLERLEERYSGGYIQKLGEGGNDLSEIARIQSRNYFRNAHANPKRRVIRLNTKANSNEAKDNLHSSQYSTPLQDVKQVLPVDEPLLVSGIAEDASFSPPLMIREMEQVFKPETKFLVDSKPAEERTKQVQKPMKRSKKSVTIGKRTSQQLNVEYLSPPPPAYVA